MEFEHYLVRDVKGNELIDEGILFDATGLEIIPDIDYKIRLYETSNNMIILSNKDWYINEQMELGNEIKKQGGLIAWCEIALKTGFYNNIKECIPVIEELIECYIQSNDQYNVEYFKGELLNLIDKNNG